MKNLKWVIVARNENNSRFRIKLLDIFSFSNIFECLKRGILPVRTLDENEIIKMIKEGDIFLIDKFLTRVIIVSKHIKTTKNKTKEDNINHLPIKNL